MEDQEGETGDQDRVNFSVPDLVVVGEKKDWNPVEEYWIQKLQRVEEQYEKHMLKLEKKLLETNATRRVIEKQDNDLKQLRRTYEEKVRESDHLEKKTAKLERNLRAQHIEKKKLEEKLEKTVANSAETEKEKRRNKYELKKCTKDIQNLQWQLKKLERDKKLLAGDKKILEQEVVGHKHKDSQSWKEKVQIFKNIRDLSTDKQVQEVEKLKLKKKIGEAAQEAVDQDRKILAMRKELGEIANAMKLQREAHVETLKQKTITKKQLDLTKEKVEKAESKLDNLRTQILSWKEEMDCKEVVQVKQRAELLKLKSENRRLRSQLAELTKNVNKLQNDIKIHESERDRVKIELKKTKAQDKALQRLMRENAFQKLRLKEKASSGQGEPTRENEQDSNAQSNAQILIVASHYPLCPTKEIDGYKRKMWELKRKLFDVERKIDEGRRRENTYRLKLQRFAAIKEQLFWTQRAMLRLEADRRGMDQMIKSFAKTMPRKIPMEKLVTDPSILDRIAKQRVLQQRLADKTAQVERMKAITEKLLQNEEKRRAEAVKRPSTFGAPQPWQLSYWKQQHETREARNFDSKDTLPPRSETDANYYKDYVGFLSQEIPRIKEQLLGLERKKQYLRAMGQGSQSRSASTSIVDLHADEVIAASPEGESEGESEEDEYEDDEYEDEEYDEDEEQEEEQGDENGPVNVSKDTDE